MHPRRIALSTTAALAAALLVPGTTASLAATPASLSYTCLPEASFIVPSPTEFEMPVDAVFEADADGQLVHLSMSTGRPVIPDITSDLSVTMSSSMAASVDGAAVTLAGRRDVTIKPDTPTDLPVLKATVTNPNATLAFTPGPMTVTFTVALFTVTIRCTPASTPVVQVAVDGREDGPTTSPTPKPTKPVLTARLTKKTQRVGKAPAKVHVTIAGTSTGMTPAGQVRTKVGKKMVARRKVTSAISFRVALPKKLKPGRHKVVVTFVPADASAYTRATAKARIRVRR